VKRKKKCAILNHSFIVQHIYMHTNILMWFLELFTHLFYVVFFASTYDSNVLFSIFMFYFSTLSQKQIILKSYVYLLDLVLEETIL